MYLNVYVQMYGIDRELDKIRDELHNALGSKANRKSSTRTVGPYGSYSTRDSVTKAVKDFKYTDNLPYMGGKGYTGYFNYKPYYLKAYWLALRNIVSSNETTPVKFSMYYIDDKGVKQGFTKTYTPPINKAPTRLVEYSSVGGSKKLTMEDTDLGTYLSIPCSGVACSGERAIFFEIGSTSFSNSPVTLDYLDVGRSSNVY